MGTVELAERKGQARAMVFLVFAAAILLVLGLSFRRAESDFLRGMWVGITAAAAVNLLPLARWLKPNSAVARLLEDETTRDHRRTATTIGFWAAMACALVLSFVTPGGSTISAFDVTRLVATFGVSTALICFATLELRASRG